MRTTRSFGNPDGSSIPTSSTRFAPASRPCARCAGSSPPPELLDRLVLLLDRRLQLVPEDDLAVAHTDERERPRPGTVAAAPASIPEQERRPHRVAAFAEAEDTARARKCGVPGLSLVEGLEPLDGRALHDARALGEKPRRTLVVVGVDRLGPRANHALRRGIAASAARQDEGDKREEARGSHRHYDSPGNAVRADRRPARDPGARQRRRAGRDRAERGGVGPRAPLSAGALREARR